MALFAKKTIVAAPVPAAAVAALPPAVPEPVTAASVNDPQVQMDAAPWEQAAEQPVAAYALAYPEWLEAKWAGNPYRDRYLERADGNEQAAKEAAASGGGDAKAAQQAYLKAVFDSPREADATLAMYDSLPNDAVRNEAYRHFFNLEDALAVRLAAEQSVEQEAVQVITPRVLYPDGSPVVVGEQVCFESPTPLYDQGAIIEGRVTDIEAERVRIEFDEEVNGDLSAYVDATAGVFFRRGAVRTAEAPTQAPVERGEVLPEPIAEVVIDTPESNASASEPEATVSQSEVPAPEAKSAASEVTPRAKGKNLPVITGTIGRRKVALWADSSEKLTGEIGGQRVTARVSRGPYSHQPFLSVVRDEDGIQIGFATALNMLGGLPVKEGVSRYMILNPVNPDDENALFGRMYITSAMSRELFDKLGFLGEQTVAEIPARARKQQPQM